MIKSELVDGFKGDGHVEVEQLGDINIGTYGPDDYVLETGKQLQAQVITNNKVRIFDGVMVIQGRRDVIAANAYTDVPIDNGAQGVKRNDIIVRRYTKDSASEIENTEFAVIKGTPGAAATDPVVTVGNIRNGDTLHNMKLYRVRIEGLNIVGVDKLYKTNMSLSTLNSNLTALNNNLGYELGSSGYTYYKKYNDGTLLMWGIVSIGYTTGSGTINFPIAFKDTLSYQLFVQQKYVSSAYVFEIISAQKMTGSLANVYSRKYPTTTDKVETHDADWFAVGRWK